MITRLIANSYNSEFWNLSYTWNNWTNWNLEKWIHTCRSKIRKQLEPGVILFSLEKTVRLYKTRNTIYLQLNYITVAKSTSIISFRNFSIKLAVNYTKYAVSQTQKIHIQSNPIILNPLPPLQTRADNSWKYC